MASRAERATSFGSIADAYDRLRPSPADQAVDWLVPPGCETAVDLGAGTGLLTRALAVRVPRVLAVEPDPRMAVVLRARTPVARVAQGRGEALPLREGSADGLFVSSAWHWMAPELAVPEVARVLRDHGRFGVIWTSRDREVDWIHEIDLLREPGEQPSQPSAHGPRQSPGSAFADLEAQHDALQAGHGDLITRHEHIAERAGLPPDGLVAGGGIADGGRALDTYLSAHRDAGKAGSAGPAADGFIQSAMPARQRPGRRQVALPIGSPFTNLMTASFRFSNTMTVGDFVDMVGTYSGIITASPSERAAALSRVRAAVEWQFPGAEQIEVPMRSYCWRADRVPR